MFKWVATMSVFSALFGTSVMFEPIEIQDFETRYIRHKIYPVMIDIRDKKDFEQFHLSQAINIPATQIEGWKAIYQALPKAPEHEWVLFMYGYDQKQMKQVASKLVETCKNTDKIQCPNHAFYLNDSALALKTKSKSVSNE